MQYQPLVVVPGAVCGGIVADRQFSWPIPVWLIGGLAGLCVWLVLWKLHRNRLSVAAVFAAVASVGGAWHHLYWHEFRADEIGRFAHELPAPV
jgi:hypothetical protein